NWSKVTRGSTSGSSPTLRFGDVGPRIGARLHRIWRCRICTSVPTGSGTCSSSITWYTPCGDLWSNSRACGTYGSERGSPSPKRGVRLQVTWWQQACSNVDLGGRLKTNEAFPTSFSQEQH